MKFRRSWFRSISSLGYTYKIHLPSKSTISVPCQSLGLSLFQGPLPLPPSLVVCNCLRLLTTPPQIPPVLSLPLHGTTHPSFWTQQVPFSRDRESQEVKVKWKEGKNKMLHSYISCESGRAQKHSEDELCWKKLSRKKLLTSICQNYISSTARKDWQPWKSS